MKHISMTSEKVCKSRRETPYLSLKAYPPYTSCGLDRLVYTRTWTLCDVMSGHREQGRRRGRGDEEGEGGGGGK